MDDSRLRYEIYRYLVDTGGAPSAAVVATWVGGVGAAHDALRRMHDAHAVVLDDAGEIRMALPFSAVATEQRVVSPSGSWWANCAWDALAIPAALGVDARVEADWLDDGSPVDLAVAGGRLTHTGGFVHFMVPARRWWDDIIET